MVSRIPRSGTLVSPPRTPVVGPSSQLELRAELDVDTLLKHLTRPSTSSQHSPRLDPKLLRLSLREFHGWLLRLKCWRCTGKSLETNTVSKSHRSRFTRLVGSQSWHPRTATTRHGIDRLYGKQPTTFICRPSTAIAIRIWRKFTSSANSGDSDPSPDRKPYCALSFRG